YVTYCCIYLFKITKAITVPMQLIMRRVTAIAKEDLSHDDLHVKYDNEIGQLVSATNGMERNMRHILEEIHRVSETVSGQSEQLTQSAGDVKTGTAQIDTTGETFQAINNAVTDMAAHIGNIAEHLYDMATNSEHIKSPTEDIALVTEEAAAGVQETAASAEQPSSATEDVSSSSEHAAKLADELKHVVSQFKI